MGAIIAFIVGFVVGATSVVVFSVVLFEGANQVTETNDIGKWIMDENSLYEIRFLCSECGESIKVPTSMFKPIWKYCPVSGNRKEEL